MLPEPRQAMPPASHRMTEYRNENAGKERARGERSHHRPIKADIGDAREVDGRKATQRGQGPDSEERSDGRTAGAEQQHLGNLLSEHS
jgi:hypothetical protein